MLDATSNLRTGLERDGYATLHGALSRESIPAIFAELEPALAAADAESGPLRGDREVVAASRNLLRLWPRAIELSRSREIGRAAVDVLGQGCGLVRVLYFDKPPGRSWSLPWHRDRTIAVREHRVTPSQFRKPTFKGGVPHVEAPPTVLRQMLTVRIHLDDVDDDNGPLLVVPGSHRDDETNPTRGEVAFQAIHATAGDALLMRPLVSHCSRKSRSGTAKHRRVIHLEFAAATPLPDGYDWHEFHAVSVDDSSPARFARFRV